MTSVCASKKLWIATVGLPRFRRFPGGLSVCLEDNVGSQCWAAQIEAVEDVNVDNAQGGNIGSVTDCHMSQL